MMAILIRSACLWSAETLGVDVTAITDWGQGVAAAPIHPACSFRGPCNAQHGRADRNGIAVLCRALWRQLSEAAHQAGVPRPRNLFSTPIDKRPAAAPFPGVLLFDMTKAAHFLLSTGVEPRFTRKTGPAKPCRMTRMFLRAADFLGGKMNVLTRRSWPFGSYGF